MARHEPILLAEDDEDYVVHMRRAFQQAGLPNALIVARNGKEAIEYLEAQAPDAEHNTRPLPALLLLDLKMPLLDGFDVLVWLHARPCLKALPVVVLSSCSPEADLQKARQFGAMECHVKPHPEDLPGLVSELRGRLFAPAKTARA
jgi:two-component system response regulator